MKRLREARQLPEGILELRKGNAGLETLEPNYRQTGRCCQRGRDGRWMMGGGAPGVQGLRINTRCGRFSFVKRRHVSSDEEERMGR